MSAQPTKPTWLPRWFYDVPVGHVRALSVFAGICILIGCVGPLFDAVDRAGSPLVVLRGLGFMFASFIAGGTTGWRAAMPGELDERERAERERALSISYTTMGLIMAFGFLWVSASALRIVALPSPYDAGWLFGGVFWLHLMLPGTILAWRDAGPELEE